MFSYKTLSYTLAVLLLGGLVYWRVARGAAADEADNKPAPPAPAPTPAPAPKHNDEIPLAALDEGIVLQSGNIKIPLKVVEKREQIILAAMKSQNPTFAPTDEWKVGLRKGVSLHLMTDALAEQYVKDNKLEATKEYIAGELELLKNNVQKDGGTYEQFLASRGFDEEDFKQAFSIVCALKQKLTTTLKDEEVQAALPLRRVSHILYMYKSERAPATVTRTKEEAKAAAEETLKKLKSGADFADLAKAGSDCPSKAQGGDLDYFPRQGAMVEPFADATYKLEKIGDLSGVVETPFGFHIIKLTDVRAPEKMKTDDSKEMLANQKFVKQMQQFFSEGSAQAKFNAKLIPAVPPKLNVLPRDQGIQ